MLSYKCTCGQHHSQAEHDIVEETVMRALFPDPSLRRRFLRAVGAGTALAAVLKAKP